MKKILLPAFCLLMITAGAQTVPRPFTYKAAITFSPLALLQIDYTIMSGAEFRLKPRVSLVADVGYVFYSSYLGGNGTDNSGTGFMIRPGLRYYVNNTHSFYIQ